MYPRPLRLILCLVTAFSLCLPTANLNAYTGATGVVKERMERMKVMKESVKTLVPIAKGKAPLNVDEIRWAAGELLKANDGLTAQFPADSIRGPSEARPEIWNHWERFVDQSDQLEQAASQMLASAEGTSLAEFRRHFKAVADTCRSCHDDFRRKK